MDIGPTASSTDAVGCHNSGDEHISVGVADTTDANVSEDTFASPVRCDRGQRLSGTKKRRKGFGKKNFYLKIFFFKKFLENSETSKNAIKTVPVWLVWVSEIFFRKCSLFQWGIFKSF